MKKIFIYGSIFAFLIFILFIFRPQIEKQFFAPQPKIEKEIELGLKNQQDTKTKEFPTKEIYSDFIQNLKILWEIVFLPNNEILVTERVGRIKIFDFEGRLKKEFQIAEVKHIGEGGLLGAELHPSFRENKLIYLYYTTQRESGLINQVVRYVFENNELVKDKIILDNIPAGSVHNGGRIKFGPDGYLYITTGDAGNFNLAQDINSLAGKILRIKDDGSIPEDNPFNNAVYAYGIRNSQGITWDKEERLWSIDHGRSGLKSGLDEINLIEKGKNYGWPIIQGTETKEGLETPILQSGPDITWAPADLLYYKGSLFFTGLRGQGLYQAIIIDEKTLKLKVHFFKEFGRLRALTLGPDGYFYISTSNTDGRGNPKEGDDKIIKINPEIFFK